MYALVATIPLPIKFHNIAILVCLLYVGVMYRWSEFSFSVFKFSLIPILIISQFLVQILGLLHVSNTSQGLQDLERCSYPIVLLVLFQFIKKENISLTKLFFAFVISSIALVLYGLLNAAITEGQIGVQQLINRTADFKRFILIQPLYLSIF